MSNILTTWAQLLPLAIAIAINPLPIIAIVLVLLTPRGRSNSAFMLIGWLVGLVALGSIALALGNRSSLFGGGADTPLARWIQGILGIGLLVLALRQWLGRPRDGKPAEEAGWMTSLAGISRYRALGLGLLLSVGNPKNILLTIGAMAAVVEVGMSTAHEILVLAGFILVASVGVGTPPTVVLLKGDKAQPMLEAWRAWLAQYSSVLMAAVLAVIGVILIIKSIK